MVELPSRPVAHTPNEAGEWHFLEDHALAVACLAARFATIFGAESLAWWLGIFHDAGKLKPEFQWYLLRRAQEIVRDSDRTDHKSLGAYIGCFRFAGYSLGQILHGHHGGLSNRTVVEGKLEALKPQDDTLGALWKEFTALPKIASASGEHAPLALPSWTDANDQLQMDVFIRMLFSCLVDADWLDTERHRDRDHYETRQRALPSIEELHARFTRQRPGQEFVDDPFQANSELERVRAEVFRSAVDEASKPQGFFRLSAPTGSGKTRSGLAFALHHATNRNLRRIIVVVPYLTITDQTATSYRDMLGGADAVLEHHSGIDPGVPDRDGRETPDELWRKLACQNWNHPLVVTTTVQFFESLLSNTTSACRKLHNIAGSVILIDEVQTLPSRMREPLFDVLLELVYHYRVTVVLTTATQPALDTIQKSLKAHGVEVSEIAPDPTRLFRRLKRVDYHWPNGVVRDWENIAEAMSHHDQALAVVNSIADAGTLFEEIGDDEAFYLSTRLCQAHRRDILRRIRSRLDANQPCTVVSTQLIEAGVDISFPVVFRALASFDRIVQAAGRCNREGELDRLGDVFVFDPGPDGSMPPGDYRLGANVTEVLLRAGELDPDDPESLTAYFSTLYRYIPSDAKEIQAKRLRHDFVDVRKAARLIDDDTFRVYVPYVNTIDDDRTKSQQKASHADRLGGLRDPSIRGEEIRALMGEAQPFLVNCANRDRDQYAKDTTIVPINDWLWEWCDNYHDRTGLQPGQLRPELLMS